MAADLERVLAVLVPARVQFIVIGGWAAALHGSARSTLDVDVVYARSRENLRALVAALQPCAPYLRGAPPGLPFTFDERIAGAFGCRPGQGRVVQGQARVAQVLSMLGHGRRLRSDHRFIHQDFESCDGPSERPIAAARQG